MASARVEDVPVPEPRLRGAQGIRGAAGTPHGRTTEGAGERVPSHRRPERGWWLRRRRHSPLQRDPLAFRDREGGLAQTFLAMRGDGSEGNDGYGAIDAFTRSPPSRPSRPFIPPILKACSGSRAGGRRANSDRLKRADSGGREAPGQRPESNEAVSKLGEILRPAARSADFHDFFVFGRSQGSKKRTK
jgi:hypothetical protein